MHPIFQIATGEGIVAKELEVRGLLGVWKSAIEDQKSGQDRKVEWMRSGYTASAIRFMRQTNATGLRPYTLDVMVQTATDSPQMAAWHASAISALSRAASAGAHEFRMTINRLVGTPDAATTAGSRAA